MTPSTSSPPLDRVYGARASSNARVSVHHRCSRASVPRAVSRDADPDDDARARFEPPLPLLDPHPPLVTAFEARRCAEARERGDDRASVSFDFWKTPRVEATLAPRGVEATIETRAILFRGSLRK